MSDVDESASPVVPLELVEAASRLVNQHIRRGVVGDYVAAEFGRPTVGRLLGRRDIARADPSEPGHGLQSTGPLLVRELALIDADARGVLAVASELLVPARLPEPVQAELASAQPLDRLLTRHGVDWQAALVHGEGYVASFDEATEENFSWLAGAGAAVQLMRMIHIGGLPAALVIDELPLRGPRPEMSLA
jgi:hypothetical protein